MKQWVSCWLALRGRNETSPWWEMRCQVLQRDASNTGYTSDRRPSSSSLDPEPSPSPPVPHSSCGPRFQGPRAVVVVDKVQTGILGATLSSFGITGLYLTFVYGLGRFLRLSMSNLRLTIPYEDLPSTRRLVTLCQDLYIARAQGELVLEEELYRILISIYRSPAVLFELTRRKIKQA